MILSGAVIEVLEILQTDERQRVPPNPPSPSDFPEGRTATRDIVMALEDRFID